MKHLVQILGIYFLGLSLHLDAQNTSVIEGDNAQTGLSIQNAGLIGIHIPNPLGAGIWIQESGLSGGIFSTNTSSTLPGIEVTQNHTSKNYHDIRLSGSRIIGSTEDLYIQLDSDNNAFDDNEFKVFSSSKSDPLFRIYSTGGITYKGSLVGGNISATHTSSTGPDLLLGGANSIIKNATLNSHLKIESNGSITVRIGQSNGTAENISEFVILNKDLEPAFSVDEIGNVRTYGSTVTSDRSKKENILKVSPESILNNLINMPIYSWNYKKRERQHIGPMAQDFLQAFNLGDDDTTISTIDADGISLAAIKGLYQLMNKELEAKSSEISSLIARIKTLENKE